jgi:hypothetical protein
MWSLTSIASSPALGFTLAIPNNYVGPQLSSAQAAAADRIPRPKARVWSVSEVAVLKVVSPAIDGPNLALVIRFEREGEERSRAGLVRAIGAIRRRSIGCSRAPTTRATIQALALPRPKPLPCG